MSTGSAMRILFVDDRREDVEATSRFLRSEGLSFDERRVETEEEMRAALDEFRPDIVISNYAMSHFDCYSALQLCLKYGQAPPLIVLTSSLDEHTAVGCLKAGATDYIVKERMDRLPFAIAEALESHEAVRAKRAAEEAQQEGEERFRTLVDAAPDGIFIQVGETVRYANPAMARLVAATEPKALVGVEISSFVAPEYLAGARERTRAQVETGLPNPPKEEEFLRADGTRVAVETSAAAIRLCGQDSHVVFVRDRTERAKAVEERQILEEQLQQAQRMESVGLLAGGVAHDFNNILMVQKGYCELMKTDLQLDKSIIDGLSQIESCADRAASLTRQLLAFSRKQVLQPVILDLNALVEDTEDMLRRLVGEAVELDIRVSSRPAFVRADPRQLEQVLVNLAANAHDAMAEGGRLRIEVSSVDLGEAAPFCRLGAAAGPNVMLVMSDSGCGMNAEVKRHAFEPFFTTKAEGKRTGLGLSTAYGIVKQSGGTIWVDSEPGEGTTVRIFLPRVDELPELAGELGDALRQGRGESILVVEDEPVLRGLVQRMVESLGYTAAVAADGAEARTLVESNGARPDLLLTDVVMPGMSGAALVEEIRRTVPDLKFVFMSGYPDSAIARHRIENATFGFLQKPFSMKDLASKLEAALHPAPAAGDRPAGGTE